MQASETELVTALRIPRALEPVWLAARLERCDHAELATLGEREGVAGLLYRDIRRGDLDASVDPPVLDRLQESYVKTAAANARRAAALRELVAHPELRDTKVVVLKGMALIENLYGDWGLRPMTDIDLWVDEGGSQASRRALLDLGYRAQPFYPDTLRRGSVVIDVHTSLLGSERIAARERILTHGEAQPFERALPFEIGGSVAWRLDPVDTVLFGCLHLLKHNASRILWLLELDALVADWTNGETAAFVDRARRSGQRHAVDLVAFLARDLLAAPEDRDESGLQPTPGNAGELSATRLARLASDNPPSRWERRTLSRRRVKGKLPVWAPLVFFVPGDKVSGRAAAGLEALFPRPTILRQIFRDDDSWLATLYVRRFLQLVEMVVRQ